MLCRTCAYQSTPTDLHIVRCVQLVWASDNDNPAAWAEFIGKIKDGVLTAFDAAVIQREDEVRRSEGQRQMPGWNFCTYFILKVSSLSGYYTSSEDSIDRNNASRKA